MAVALVLKDGFIALVFANLTVLVLKKSIYFNVSEL